MKNIYTFRGRKCESEPAEPKNGIWGLKLVWSCDISIDREFNMEHEKYTLEGQKDENKPPKTEFGAQNHYGRVTYPVE
jgi:hypothetical protein